MRLQSPKAESSPTRPAAQLEEPAEQLDSADQRMQCVG